MEKLDKIEDGANKYVHPLHHSVTIIQEDETHRFVTDEEKNLWNTNNIGVLTGNMSNNQLYTLDDGIYLAKNLQLESITNNLLGTVIISTNLEDLRSISIEIAVFDQSNAKIFIKKYLSFGTIGRIITSWHVCNLNFNVLIN